MKDGLGTAGGHNDRSILTDASTLSSKPTNLGTVLKEIGHKNINPSDKTSPTLSCQYDREVS